MDIREPRRCQRVLSAHRPTKHLALVGESRSAATSFGERYTTVRDWRLLRTYRGTLHLAGHIGQRKEVWATPSIVRIDPILHVAIATNGTRYLMLGNPGEASTAAHVVSLCAAFDGRLSATEDVTHGLTNQLHTAALYLESLAALRAKIASTSKKNPLDFSS